MFLVIQTILNLHLLLVNITSLLIGIFVNFSFDSEKGSHRIVGFRSSNNHSGIILSFLSLLKYSIVFLIEFIGKLADKNFFIMRFTSKLKSSAILLALCKSPVMTLRLYPVGMFEDQCTGSFTATFSE